MGGCNERQQFATRQTLLLGLNLRIVERQKELKMCFPDPTKPGDNPCFQQAMLRVAIAQCNKEHMRMQAAGHGKANAHCDSILTDMLNKAEAKRELRERLACMFPSCM